MKRLLLVLGVAVLLLAACGDDSSSDDSSSAASDETSATTTESAPSTTAGDTSSSDTADDGSSDQPDYGDEGSTGTEPPASSGGSGQTVALAEVAGLGQVLVGPDGRTLYLFDMDSGTTSACTGGCADAWPGLTAGTGDPTAGEGVDVALLSTADGQVAGQVAYNGHLLYYFSGDEAPGDANGVGLPSWYPVDAAGNAVDAT
jgi:predicted lipoprotein with Yx(FWY)xxD motif